MTADELHALAVRTRDAARLAERHGTSTHGYRRAAREACERMGEMAEQLADAEERAQEYSLDALAMAEPCRSCADLDEQLAEMTRERDQLAAEVTRARAAEETSTIRAADLLRDNTEWQRRVALLSRDIDAVRAERFVARAQLRDLVAALSLDDGPRAKAIQHARAVLEEWGMR